MAIKKLIDQKEEIVAARAEKLAKINQGILDRTAALLQDRKLKGEAKVGILRFLQGMTKFGSEKSVEMESGDRLALAKIWLENAENMRKTVAAGYDSVMKDIDDQLALYRSEIVRIDEELAQSKGREDREKREEKKKQDRMVRAS